MTPVDFPASNVQIAEHQPEYLTLPALHIQDDNGVVISRWQGTWRERLTFLLTGKLWVITLTFNMPFQPLMVETEQPFSVGNS